MLHADQNQFVIALIKLENDFNNQLHLSRGFTDPCSKLIVSPEPAKRRHYDFDMKILVCKVYRATDLAHLHLCRSGPYASFISKYVKMNLTC